MSTAEWRNQRHHKLAGVEMDHDEDCPVCKKYERLRADYLAPGLLTALEASLKAAKEDRARDQ